MLNSLRKKGKILLRLVVPAIDVIMVGPIFLSGLIMRVFRRVGAGRLPFSKACLMKLGIFPIQDHYYEPLFHPRHIRHPLSNERALPGIDWNEDGQLAFLKSLNFSDEIRGKWNESIPPPGFYIKNGSFESGDAEYWYNVVRYLRPKRILEVGSGFSTIIAQQAIKKNKLEVANYACEHLCIEPYEAAWLEELDIKVFRSRVEEMDIELFLSLDGGDILFIDSSHMIRPQGDVLTEFLQILPQLKSGVVVHVHDIFSPRDYSERSILKEVSFWNEQYLLEAFLTQNNSWRIIGAVNYLKHRHQSELSAVCPYITPEREPGSFYMIRI